MDVDKEKYLNDLDWNKLKRFYYVAKVGNISSAANLLKTSQPSISAQISSLEKQLGYPLFTRSLKGVSLTRKGEKLFKTVEKIFLEVKAFVYNHQFFDKNKKGNGQKRKIRIATTHAMSAYIINPLLSNYRQENPHIVFELISNDKLLDIVMNDVDIAIRPYFDDEYLGEGIEKEYLFTLQKRLYASQEYINIYGEPKVVEDLKNHHLIAAANAHDYPYSDVNWILTLGMPEGKLNKYCFSSNSVECQIAEAVKGKGIVSSYQEMSIVKDSNLVNVLPKIIGRKIKDYIVYPNYLKEDDNIMHLKEFLKLNLGNNS